MMSASLNHCKTMGGEPGRRFLKQPAAKLESVIVVKLTNVYFEVKSTILNNGKCLNFIFLHSSHC